MQVNARQIKENHRDSVVVVLVWFGIGAIVAFAVPFIFSSVLDFRSDVYYLIYFTLILGFLSLFIIRNQVDVGGLFRRNWRLSLVLGIAAAAFVVFNVLNRGDPTARPDSPYLIFAVLWRGIAYGIVDALLLSAFPVAVAQKVFRGDLETLKRKSGFAALALGLVMIITATYHLGYDQFREDGIAAPETGNTIISLPAIITANPIGSIVAHTSMHVTAVLHAYETEVFLPPQTPAD